jgi:hypothetical protein
MSQLDDPIIERTADLEMDADRLWELISTADGWRSWLVDDTDVVVVPEATGTATDDGIEREVRVETVTEGRTIGFSWWRRDDPSYGSYVQLDIVELPHGRSQLRIAERFSTTTPTATMSAAATMSWDVRMVSLWLLGLHSTVMA